MISTLYLSLWLQLSRLALALPASSPINLSTINRSLPNNALTSASAAADSPRSFNTSNLGDQFLEYPITGTPLVLAFNLKTTVLDADSLFKTLHNTQVRIRTMELVVPGLDQFLLLPTDDPYQSLPQDSQGAFFGITHWPGDVPPRLTYGMVDMVLTGLIDVLVSQMRYCAATFLVKHTLLHHVAIGRVEEKRGIPDPLGDITAARGTGQEKDQRE